MRGALPLTCEQAEHASLTSTLFLHCYFLLVQFLILLTALLIWEVVYILIAFFSYKVTHTPHREAEAIA
jgi:hypothetical protein